MKMKIKPLEWTLPRNERRKRARRLMAENRHLREKLIKNGVKV